VSLDSRARTIIEQIHREYSLWRQEPARRVAIRSKLTRSWRVHQFYSFGPYSIVDRPYWLYAPWKIAVGERVIILRGGWLAVEKPAWDTTAPVLTIGDRVAIRTGCTISCAESIVIEDDVGMGANVTVIDSRHTWTSGNPNPMHSPVESSPIRIGAGSWVADRATIAAGAEIGVQCAIGPNSVVSGAIADYSIVLGNPGRVVGSTRS
jgi:acetyltransferase-like isoleucine patch superfamily enzyme